MLYRVQKENVTDFSFLWNNNTSSAFSSIRRKIILFTNPKKVTWGFLAIAH